LMRGAATAISATLAWAGAICRTSYILVEAAGIEPSREHHTSDALAGQEPHTNATPGTACEELIDTFRALSEQKQNTFLHSICEIYVKWTELPPSVRKAVEERDSLPERVREGIERLLCEAGEGKPKANHKG